MKKILTIVRYILIAVCLIFFLFPVYWLVITAFKPSNEWFTMPPRFFPTRPTLSNFFGTKETEVFGGTTGSIENIFPYLRNSIVVGVSVALIGTVISALAAYAIARYRVGGPFLAEWIISIRMLPPIVSAVPLYVIFTKLRLINTWWALILSHLVIVVPLGVWLLISFFREIPREIDEAAYVDGATPFQTFFYVILPLSAPGLAAVAVLSLIQSWGEFLLALVLTNDARAQTLPIFLGRYITGWRVAWGPLSAAGIVTLLPVVIFALVAQRYLIRGLTFGAVKG
ncbi:binding-protein-dependent transport systems inner membrane component [Thermotoga petrophila RKU-10]|jgi:multiple sugar transport system permease protein|uniref:Binding-protein-dependent transport systems inner membrane component n=2 Tax=Thermotoga petrophila TaxID=93929 RepID=A5IKE1_THEP1|nr:carbohydrate ABC transporter permease [Thermotoga petrophila]ABQ46664.1 binding-protein-dependent transport systems inner membrane component [Thermotoga petrophila RKU-1]ADA66999.1 binding-protein-dependent transport systems inner membrane component [Thermotoga petrophila RKU-10]